MHSFQFVVYIGAALSSLTGTVNAGTLKHGHLHQARNPQSLNLNDRLMHRSTALTNDTHHFHRLAAANAVYSLRDTYDASNFFSTFNFFTASDPTHGFVNYLSQADAQSRGLASITNNQVRLGVDTTTVNPPSPGRASTRLTSNKAYTHGLYIADIAHMPGSICGVWPAFWTVGPNWPGSGEIDIIEGVHKATTDTITLHTTATCNINNDGSQAGVTTSNTNCNANSGYDGCGATTTHANAYGTPFNNVGGGVYAMQWESSGVYVWFFQRGSIPADITSGNPDTTLWGLPLVAFNGNSCDFDAHFANHNIVFDTTFCGDWAGQQGVWTGSGCGGLASTCNDYVAANPGAFTEAYWLINSVKVYQL